MSTPAAKRRRIEAMHTAVSQPFRSPFKGPKATPPPSALPTPTPIQNPTLPPPILPSSPATTHPSPPPQTPRFNHRALATDPAIAPLLKTQRLLDSQLRELQDELDIAKQAARIEEASKRWALSRKGPGAAAGSEGFEIDGELRELIAKWRAASRMAAEELFGGVRDRVNRMGGPLAFRQAQEAAAQRQREFQAEWNEAPSGGGEGEEEGEEGEGRERDLYAEYGGGEVETENERRARGGEEGGAEGDGDEDGDGFTMGMMLKTLNVDLKVIGYDKEMQRWTD